MLIFSVVCEISRKRHGIVELLGGFFPTEIYPPGN